MQKRFVTIHDVAADAKVSTATVSRALNEPWRVRADTIQRVHASVARLGYSPNLRARLLARGGSGTVCFLLSNRPFVHSVHAQILQGAAQEADELHVQMVYAACNYSHLLEPQDIQLPRIVAARGMVDGVIAAGTNYPNLLRALDELDMPHVTFGTNLVAEDDARIANAVYVDDEDGGYQAASHLLSLGHTSIRFIGDVSLPWYRRRYLGFARAMNQAGLDAPPPAGSAAEGELAMGSGATNELCDRGEEFTALFVGGDMGALGALRALANHGIHVPGQVSVVGFNDEELAQIAEPPLTTVRVPKEQIGAACVRMLDARIRGTHADTGAVVMPAMLVMRQSTAAVVTNK